MKRSSFPASAASPVPEAHFQPRLLQPLLFSQCLSLAFVLGSGMYLWPPCGTVLGLILWIDKRCREPKHGFLLLLAVTLGFANAAWRDPSEPPPVPSWISDRQPSQLSAVVSDVRGLPGQRVRLFLDELVVRGESLPGKLIWTWDTPAQRLTPGMRVHLALKILPVRGIRNQGTGEDSGLYWRRQGVFWRAWSGGIIKDLVVEPPERQSTSWLERLRILSESRRAAWLNAYVTTLNRLHPLPETPFRYGMAPPSAPHGWGFLPALVFGDRAWIGLDDMERLTKAGLVHSIALSGQHLAIVALLAGGLVMLWQRVRPGILLCLPRSKLVLVLSLPLALGYLWLGNAPPSLQRAALMLLFWTVFRLANRPTAFPDALLAALFCLTLVNPFLLADIGVQLSFSSVAGIALITPTLSALWERTVPRSLTGAGQCFRNVLLGTLLCSLAVQIATLPLVLVTFGRVPALFLLNLIWLPVLGFWVLPLALLGLAAVVMDLTGTSGLLLTLAMKPCFLLTETLRILEDQGWLQSPWLPRPHWTSCLGWGILTVALAFALNRPRPLPRSFRRMLLAGSALLICGPLNWLAGFASTDIRLRLLDVGQGQAVLIEGPGHHRLLIDGGGLRSARFDTGRDILRPLLTANSPLRVDRLALSHPDLDHLRGLLFLARHAAVQEVLLPASAPGHKSAKKLYQTFQEQLKDRNIPLRFMSSGETLELAPGLRIEVLAPGRGERQRANDGLILRLVLHGHGLAVIPGDAETPTLNRLARTNPSLQADVLIAPHHGSRNNLSKAFIRAVNPRVVLVSCGAFNRWGFPSEELRRLLTEWGIPLRVTADEGELTVSWQTAPPDSPFREDLFASGTPCTMTIHGTSR